jgi:hypothetical protein
MTNKSARRTQKNIAVRDISNNSGMINIGEKITVDIDITNNASKLEEVAKAFEAIYTRIETSQATSVEKEVLKTEVEDVEAAIKNPKVDESFVSRRLRNIGRMAPDILDVILATITSPAAGLGMIGKKIAERVKEK